MAQVSNFKTQLSKQLECECQCSKRARPQQWCRFRKKERRIIHEKFHLHQVASQTTQSPLPPPLSADDRRRRRPFSCIRNHPNELPQIPKVPPSLASSSSSSASTSSTPPATAPSTPPPSPLPLDTRSTEATIVTAAISHCKASLQHSASALLLTVTVMLALSLLAGQITPTSGTDRRISFSANPSPNLSKNLINKSTINDSRLIVDTRLNHYNNQQINLSTSASASTSSLMPVQHVASTFRDIQSLGTVHHLNKEKEAVDVVDQQEEEQAEDDYELEEPQPNRFTDSADSQKLLKLVMDGLGLTKLPDVQKANISQQEYATKYQEYLSRVRQRERRELQQFGNPLHQLDWEETIAPLNIMTILHNATEAAMHYRRKRSAMTTESIDRRQQHRRRKQEHQKQQQQQQQQHRSSGTTEKNSIVLHFPLNIDVNEVQPSDIEEANIRLLLITSPALAVNSRRRNKQQHQRRRENASRINGQSSPQSAAAPRKRYNTAAKVTKHMLNLKVYQLLEPNGRLWLDGRKIEIVIDRSKTDETTSQWLEFDVTKAVEGWLINKQPNVGLEIQCDNCYRNGARIIDDLSSGGGGGAAAADVIMSAGSGGGNTATTPSANKDDDDEDVDDDDGDDDDTDDNDDDDDESGFDLTPVLNIIGRLGTHREKRSKSYHHHHHHHHHQHQHQNDDAANRQPRKTNCYKDNQRCCRHTMDVVFKEIKGFEFIIQPKGFDAGYCRGRCPPRYNPAHHHALLQSLIWKQDRSKVPRPCCAPSKLVELEVLHVDEKDSEKLKISTWTDMRVLECACS